jgi:hypothetical protein
MIGGEGSGHKVCVASLCILMFALITHEPYILKARCLRRCLIGMNTNSKSIVWQCLLSASTYSSSTTLQRTDWFANFEPCIPPMSLCFVRRTFVVALEDYQGGDRAQYFLSTLIPSPEHSLTLSLIHVSALRRRRTK